jgi:sugar O-acyltransferase (sialic acid O-acetyltransferase NeuD family)
MKRLLIVGTGGQGKVVMDSALNSYDSITFMTNDAHGIDDYKTIYERDISTEYIASNFDEIIVAIGNNNTRLNLSLKYISQGLKLATIIHPAAVVSKYARIEEGTVVFANAVVNPYAKIGKACIINTGAIVEHDCVLEDGVHISPNAAMGGTVYIGKKTWVCVGSCIANNIKVGQEAVIAAGAVVIKDVPDKVLVAGVPAKILKSYT